MKYILQIGIVVLFLFLGELTNKLTGLPIPGSVFGMIYLFIALNTKVVKLEQVEEVGDFLLNNILLFFVPIGVSLIASFKLIEDTWWMILLIVIISTFLVMGVTGLIVQLLARGKDE